MRHPFIASSGLALSALALFACSEGGSSSDNGDSALVTTLRFDEIMYNSGVDSLEWVEFHISAGPALENMQASGLRLDGAIEYAFPAEALDVDERVVVASDTAAFRAKYPYSAYPVRLFGPWTGRLDNAGEDIELKVTGSGDAVCSYSNDPPWPTLAAGHGYSLVYVSGDPSYPESYGANSQSGGNPGKSDVVLAALSVRVNEVKPGAALESGLDSAWIELYNAGSSTVDLSGWILAENAEGTDGYTLPSGTSLSANAYLVVHERQWNASAPAFYPGTEGKVYLLESVNASLSGRTTGLSYLYLGAGSSAGVYALSSGALLRGPLSSPSPGSANSALASGNAYISEIHYNPADSTQAEFMEIANRTATALDLGGWAVEGIAFTFPTGTTLPASGKLLLVRSADTDTASFRSDYSVPASVSIYAYSGKLSNGGESLLLKVPAGDGHTTYADAVLYSDTGSWPSEADGEGSSLQRNDSSLPGSDPSAWKALAPSPGL